ncbi:MAG: putative branched-chain amino acid transporter ATP-binding protein [Ilumatobacteraceae bacterium]|nr:putative branched-chain amino acid transporter ATP-binding protein [Ilumatobacteraceae bacterium]
MTVDETSLTSGTTSGPSDSMLSVSGLRASYGQIEALHGVDFYVGRGEVVVVLGANGAGKTTTLRALCQMVSTKGSIVLDGVNISNKSTTEIARRGVAHVPQGRGTLSDLSVDDNLLAGAYIRKDKGVAADMDKWYGVFPRLRERRHQLAGSLSGGEQQMLAVARALMSRPKLLLLDEPSLGLAPIIVQGLFQRFSEMNATEGITMLIVEQNANLALDIADRAYVLEAGETVLTGTADDLRHDDGVRKAYLGY